MQHARMQTKMNRKTREQGEGRINALRLRSKSHYATQTTTRTPRTHEKIAVSTGATPLHDRIQHSSTGIRIRLD